jgi:hypothetical protein
MSPFRLLLTRVVHLDYITPMNSPTSFRLSSAAIDLLERLSTLLGIGRSAVMELALRELNRRHKEK